MCELLWAIAHDKEAPATARASAIKSWLEATKDEEQRDESPATEMTIEELDQAIAAHERKQ